MTEANKQVNENEQVDLEQAEDEEQHFDDSGFDDPDDPNEYEDDLEDDEDDDDDLEDVGDDSDEETPEDNTDGGIEGPGDSEDGEDEDTEDEQPKQRIEKVIKSLKCRLTDEEFVQASEELAKALDRKTALEEALQSIKAQYKSDIQRCDADVFTNTSKVRNKYVYREIICEKIFDYENTKVMIVRKDTGEIVNDRTMFDDEKQMKLKF